MKLINVTRLLLYAFVIACIAHSCVKEGPIGLTGSTGANGTNGTDANETCKMCHNPTMVDLIATQFTLSKHSYGTASFSEAGTIGCDPCHTQEGFKYVVKANIPSTFRARVHNRARNRVNA